MVLTRVASLTNGVQVYEEIGFDVSPLIVEADYVETIQQQEQQRTKLFIIPGVPEEVLPCCAAPAPPLL